MSTCIAELYSPPSLNASAEDGEFILHDLTRSHSFPLTLQVFVVSVLLI